MELHLVLLLAEFLGLVHQALDAAVPQGDQGGVAALPQVAGMGKGSMPGLQHHWECLLALRSP